MNGVAPSSSVLRPALDRFAACTRLKVWVVFSLEPNSRLIFEPLAKLAGPETRYWVPLAPVPPAGLRVKPRVPAEPTFRFVRLTEPVVVLTSEPLSTAKLRVPDVV